MILSYSYYQLQNTDKHRVVITKITSLCSAAPGAAAPAVQQSIDISYPPGPQQQTCCTLLQQNNRTDERTPNHFIDPALHTIQTVPTNAKT